MGIARGSIKFLMEEGLRKPFGKKALTLGKQDIWCSFVEITDLAKELNFPLQKEVSIELSSKPAMRSQGLISDLTFFKLLGFDELVSLDASDYEQADCIHDLNDPNLPSNLIGKFDLVIDGGTLEHVFNIPQALFGVFQLLKVEGRIIHISPSSNHIDHGFYMFSPTLFWDFYEVNSFELNRLYLIRYAPQGGLPWRVCDYKPGCLNKLSYGGLDSAMYAIGCVATKMSSSTGNKIPQQRNYIANEWENPPHVMLIPNRILEKIKTRIKQQPLLYQIICRIMNALKLRGIRHNKTRIY